MEANAAANRWFLYLCYMDSRGLSAQTCPIGTKLDEDMLENYLIWCQLVSHLDFHVKDERMNVSNLDFPHSTACRAYIERHTKPTSMLITKLTCTEAVLWNPSIWRLCQKCACTDHAYKASLLYWHHIKRLSALDRLFESAGGCFKAGGEPCASSSEKCDTEGQRYRPKAQEQPERRSGGHF